MTTELAPPDCQHCRHLEELGDELFFCIKTACLTSIGRKDARSCGPEGRHFAVASFPVLEARGLAGKKAKP